MRYILAISAIVALAWCGQDDNRVLGQETGKHQVSGWSSHAIEAIHKLPVKDRYVSAH